MAIAYVYVPLKNRVRGPSHLTQATVRGFGKWLIATWHSGAWHFHIKSRGGHLDPGTWHWFPPTNCHDVAILILYVLP